LVKRSDGFEKLVLRKYLYPWGIRPGAQQNASANEFAPTPGTPLFPRKLGSIGS
jgi:hypothetical protein